MNNCVPQSQPVETSMEEDEFPPLSLVDKTQPPSQSTQDQDPTFAKLTAFMRTASEPDFEDSLKLMNEHFAKGEASLFLEETEIQKRLMNSFVRLSRELQKNSQAESKMLFILSLIAEMIKESPHFNFPFTRKFLLTVFEIDNESLQHASYKNQIMAILSVIYSNISSQFRLLKKLNVEKELKNALMTNYYLINQLFTLKLFNRSILNLASKGVAFTSADFAKHAILDTISKFIAKNQVETFLTRMKTCMFQPKYNPPSDLKQNPNKLML